MEDYCFLKNQTKKSVPDKNKIHGNLNNQLYRQPENASQA